MMLSESVPPPKSKTKDAPIIKSWSKPNELHFHWIVEISKHMFYYTVRLSHQSTEYLRDPNHSKYWYQELKDLLWPFWNPHIIPTITPFASHRALASFNVTPRFAGTTDKTLRNCNVCTQLVDIGVSIAILNHPWGYYMGRIPNQTRNVTNVHQCLMASNLPGQNVKTPYKLTQSGAQALHWDEWSRSRELEFSNAQWALNHTKRWEAKTRIRTPTTDGTSMANNDKT